MLSLAIPNEFLAQGSPLIGLFALVPFYVCLSRAKSVKAVFWLSFLQAAVVHLLSSFWLGYFQDFAVFTLGASDLGTGGFFALMSMPLYFAFAPFYRTKKNRLEERGGIKPFALPLRIFWFAGVYTIWEWCKSTGFLAYPWGTLSMTAVTWPLVTQIADITGPYGVTFLFALISATVAEGILILPDLSSEEGGKKIFAAWKSCVNTAAILSLSTVLYGIIQYNMPRKPVKQLNAVLVQQNLDPWRGTDLETINISKRLTREKLQDFNKKGEKADLVVWSEAVLTGRFPGAAVNKYKRFPKEEPLMDFIAKSKTPFVIGAPLTVDSFSRKYSNAAVLIDKDGIFRGAYSKIHLVPFAEVFPGRNIPFVYNFFRNTLGFSTWEPGERYVLFDIPISTPEFIDRRQTEIISLRELPQSQASVKISTPICFDDAFGEVCRGLFLAGSEVFINLTNDSWSLTRSAEIQHLAVATYRAIEYRTTLARATNAGCTVVVGPNGKIQQKTPLFEENALAAEIPVYRRVMTVYARFGDWLPGLLIALAFLHLGLFLRKSSSVD